MAEKRTIDINIKNNADEATKDFNTFNDALDETAKSAKNVNSTFEEVYGDLQPLTTRLGEAEDRLYELALAGDTTSKEYQELLTKVGEYRKVQIQTDLAVDGAAQTFSQKLGSALNGVTSGFAVTQGAMALFGSENEKLEKTLLKVQAALAIQQGVLGLTTAYRELAIGTKIATAAKAAYATVVGTTTGVLKAFRIALASTGIGLLVVGIGLLIANFEKVTKVIKNAIDVALVPVKAAIDAIVDAYYAVTDALGITSKAERDREKQAVAHAKASRKRNQQLIEEYRKEKEAIENNIEATKNYQKAQEKRYDRQIELLQAEGKETRKIEKLKLQLNVETQKQILQDRIKGLKEAQKTNNNLTKVFAKVQLGAQIERLKEAQFEELKFDKATNKIKLDNYKEYLKERKEADQKELDEEIDAEIQLLAELDKIRQENEARFRTQEENELNAVAEKYDVLEAMAYGNAEALNEIEIARLNEENEIKAKYATEAYNAQKALDDKADADRKAREQKEIADAKATQQAKIQFANDALGAIGDLANAFAGDSEKSQRRAFKINKAVGLAQAIINTAGAVSAAINPAVGGLGIPAGLPGAILAAATGAAQIATIAKTKFEGGSTGDVSAPSESGLGAVQAPEFNVVGDAGINQLAQLQQQPTQAYVVSGEVTSAQALDRNRVTNATL